MQMNILLVIGIIMLLGTVFGRVFQKLKLPSVMGYMVIGLLLGESFQGLLAGPVMDSFRPVLELALGIIGFMIGSEILLDRFKRYSRSIYTILAMEAILTFMIVCATTTLLTGKLYMGLILGALASATAPAATYSVLGEYKARGPLTTTTLSIVALDDALALLIYGFASVFARSMIVKGGSSLLGMMMLPVGQILFSVAIGGLCGFALYKVSVRTRSREKMLPLALGTIIFVVGLSIFIKVDPILASMVLGAVAANFHSDENREMFDLIKRFSPPIFILFFVLVGAKLDYHILTTGGVFVLALAYIASRTFGKIAGAYLGGKLSGAKRSVTQNLGFCLMDQAGVAVGLAIATFNTFSALGDEFRLSGLLIINVITATTFLLQLLSPPMIKFGISRADEMFRNVTEEDIVKAHKVKDVMEEDFFVMKENYNLHQIIDVMKKTDAFNFPVVHMNGDFLGVISLGEMRDAFNEEQMDFLVLAGDIVKEMDVVVYAKQELSEVMDIFKRRNIDYLPVMFEEGSKKLVGQLVYPHLKDYITKEVILRQQELES
ncbi:MAG: CBS domain-containing protein [Candidatus Omnitrophica bacterium]|nr:CBS domain-containing protein [Candidatus Omnitrophota bacterium]